MAAALSPALIMCALKFRILPVGLLALPVAWVMGVTPCGAAEDATDAPASEDSLWEGSGKFLPSVPLMLNGSGPDRYSPLLRSKSAASRTTLLITPAQALVKGRTPEEVYFEAEELMAPPVQSGVKEAAAFPDFDGGKGRLLKAFKHFRAIQEVYPDWRPQLIQRRLNQLAEKFPGLSKSIRKQRAPNSPDPTKPQLTNEGVDPFKKAAPEADDPSQRLNEIHGRMEEAGALERSNQHEEAENAFREAGEKLQALKQRHPFFYMNVVEAAQKRIRLSMERLGRKDSRNRTIRRDPGLEEESKWSFPAESGHVDQEGSPGLLRRRLMEMEQQLDQLRRREAALRRLVRELLDDPPPPLPR